MPHPLYQLRKRLEMTQAEMAEALGVTHTRVSQIERHGGRLNDENMIKLQEKYRVELAQLGLSMEDFLRARVRPSPEADHAAG